MKIYIVEKLLAATFINHERYFLVKWKNFDINESTWEPESNLYHFKNEIKHLLKKQDLINRKLKIANNLA